MAEDPGAIRDAIEQTRSDMAETVAALGHKADLKGRLGKEVQSVTGGLRTEMTTRTGHLRSQLQGGRDGVLIGSGPKAREVAGATARAVSGLVEPARRRNRVMAGTLAVVIVARRIRRRRRATRRAL